MTPFFTHAQLTSVQSVSDAVTELKAMLTGSGIQGITDWSEGTFQYAFLQLAAFLYVQSQQRAATIAEQSLEPTASGDYLTLVSEGFFQNERFEGTRTVGNMRVQLAPGQGPYTFGVGELQITFQGAYTFSNRTAFTLPNGTSLAFNGSFEATEVGADHNIAAGDSGTLVRSFAGISVTNPPDPTLPQGNWISIKGSDSESDEALHIRNQTKWSTLPALANVADRFRYVAVSASLGQLTDVVVTSNALGPGTVQVYCSTPTEVATADILAMVSGSLQSLVMNGTNLVTATTPVTSSFGSGGVNTAVQVYYAPSFSPTLVLSGVAAALDAFVGSVPTGGNTYSPTVANIADIDDAIALLYAVPGVKKVVVSNQGDIPLGGPTLTKLVSPAWVAPLVQLTASL